MSGTTFLTEDGYNISLGKTPRVTVVHKFGKNEDVGTTFEPLSYGGLYPTLHPNNAVPIRIKAGGNAYDNVAGLGARYITVEGIDANGDIVIDTLATNGASASANTANSYIRAYRAYVAQTGTYGTQTAGSHNAAITLEAADSTTDWIQIPVYHSYPMSQSFVGVYTIPRGYKGYIKDIVLNVDSNNKRADFIFFRRAGVTDISPPYEAVRAQLIFDGLTGSFDISDDIPLGPYVGPCDVGWMVRADATCACSVDYEILLIKDNVPDSWLPPSSLQPGIDG